jgi:hypothetical protein
MIIELKEETDRKIQKCKDLRIEVLAHVEYKSEVQTCNLRDAT